MCSLEQKLVNFPFHIDHNCAFKRFELIDEHTVELPILTIIFSVPNITIHCVRHAQGYHNLNEANHQIRDPDLTPLGEKQCETLRTAFPYHDRITHLVASPIRRTIYTCLLAFESCITEKGLHVIGLPELQETSDLPCDTGSDPPKLKEEFGSGKWKDAVDLSLVKDGWNDKSAGGPWAPSAAKIEARAKVARRWLRDLGLKSEKENVDIVVVTHGGYLHYFTEDWTGHDKFLGTGWQNTEFRSYTFSHEDDENASVVETAESRERRKGLETPLTADEQRELKATAENGWLERGLQTNDNQTKL